MRLGKALLWVCGMYLCLAVVAVLLILALIGVVQWIV